MYCIVQQDRQSNSRIPMKSWCCVPVSPQNILEMHAGKNNPWLNLHHLSAHQIISFQVNNFLSSLSFQVGYEHAKGLEARLEEQQRPGKLHHLSDFPARDYCHH